MAASAGSMGLPLFFSSNATATRMAVFSECFGKSLAVLDEVSASPSSRLLL
jgi:hypothetical protein